MCETHFELGANGLGGSQCARRDAIKQTINSKLNKLDVSQFCVVAHSYFESRGNISHKRRTQLFNKMLGLVSTVKIELLCSMGRIGGKV